MPFSSHQPMEHHPLKPFLPANARVLMLGSFPPPRQRWSMDFFYPNFTNDMWRIMGQVFFNNKDYFVDQQHKTFKLATLRTFLEKKGIALYDTATVVRRTAGTAGQTCPTPARTGRRGAGKSGAAGTDNAGRGKSRPPGAAARSRS